METSTTFNSWEACPAGTTTTTQNRCERNLQRTGLVVACTYREGGNSVRGFFRRGKFRTGNIPHLSQKIKGKIPHLPNLECIANKGDPGIAIPKRHTIQQSNQQ